MAVTVDDDFARFGGKSYAINKITSVEVREHRPNGIGPPAFLGITAACFFAATIASGSSATGMLSFICAVAAVIFGMAASKVDYQLFLMTSSAEVQAFVSEDQSEVLALRDKVEAAMIRHSRGERDR